MRGAIEQGARGCALLLVCAALACGDEAAAPTSDVPARLPPTAANFTEVECPFTWFLTPIQCGYVESPEDHQQPDGKAIRLFVARYFSEAPTVEDDPIFYLAGGPGGEGNASIDRLRSLVRTRDLVVVDQRGTGSSEPFLGCAELSTDDQTFVTDDREPFVAALTACRDRLIGEGIDLSKYNSAQNAADIDVVRRALGYEQINLLGISYGTRLGLTILRDHPEMVRSAVLDSVLPLQIDAFSSVGASAQRSLERIAETCAAQAECNEAYPDVLSILDSALAYLDESPFLVRSAGIRMNGNRTLELIFNLLYDAESLAFIPLFINELNDRRFITLNNLVEAFVETRSRFSYGMYMSVMCAEEGPFTSTMNLAAASADLTPRIAETFNGPEILESCDIWGVPDADAIEAMAVQSDVPTLLLSGEFDPITPPAYAELVAEDLSAAQWVNLNDDSHGVVLSRCGRNVALDWFENPGTQMLDPCRIDRAPPGYVTE